MAEAVPPIAVEAAQAPAPEGSQNQVVVVNAPPGAVVVVQDQAPEEPARKLPPPLTFEEEMAYTGTSEEMALIERDRLKLRDRKTGEDYGVYSLREREIGDRCGIAVQLLFVNFRMWIWIFTAGSVLAVFMTIVNLCGDGADQVDNTGPWTPFSLGNLALTTPDNGGTCVESEDHKSFLFVLTTFLMLIFFQVIMGQLSYEGTYNEQIEAEVDDGNTTACDFTIMLENLPPECTAEDIRACFKHENTCKNAYEALPAYNCPGGVAKIVEPANNAEKDMVIACFDVNDLVLNYKEKKVSQIIESQVSRQMAELGESPDGCCGKTSRGKVQAEMQEKLRQQVTAYNKACLVYDKTKNDAVCTGIGFIVFQFTEHRDAVYRYFVPQWCTWFWRNLCCCCAEEVPRICGRQLGSWREFCGLGPYLGCAKCCPKVVVTQAPEPSEIYWENFGLTEWERFKKIANNMAILFAIILVCGGVIFGLECAKYATAQNADGGSGSAVFGLFVAAVVLTVNNTLKTFIIQKTDQENHYTATSRTNILIFRLSVFYILMTVAVPMILFAPPKSALGDNDGADWWSAEGISSTGTMLVLSNIFVGPACLYFGPDRVVLRWIADKTTQKQMNMAYAPPPFDMAEYYSQVILTFCLGLYFSPFVPLCIPMTTLALTAQYWSLKHMLVKVTAIPPQMSMGFQQYVRHVLRGIMFFWIFVIDAVFERACGGTGECTGDTHGADNSRPECVCGDGVGFMILMFIFSWLAWTFLPCKAFFCRCFPACVMGIMKCCSRNTASVAPAPGDTPRPPREDFSYPMTKQDIQAREEYDGPGSWTYELPTPALYGGIDTSVPIPDEIMQEVHGGGEGNTVVVVQNNAPPAAPSAAPTPPPPPAPPAPVVVHTPDPA